jgi:hypothetical protein
MQKSQSKHLEIWVLQTGVHLSTIVMSFMVDESHEVGWLRKGKNITFFYKLHTYKGWFLPST